MATTAAIDGSDALDCFSIVDMSQRLGRRRRSAVSLLYAHRQPIVDGYHSWRCPCGSLNSLVFIPIVHDAFKSNLAAVLDSKAYPSYF